MDGIEYDVIIIGAGISGLTAARLLRQRDSNLQVAVIEAKDRVGGRTECIELKAANGTDVWDIGGQWVGRCQPHIMKLLEELGIKTYSQYIKGSKFLQVGKGDKVTSYSSTIPTLSLLGLLDVDGFLKMTDKLALEVDPVDPYCCPKAELWDGMTLETLINKHIWTGEAKELITTCMRTIFGAEPAQLSVLYYLMYVAAAGGMKKLTEGTEYTAQEYKIAGGAKQISLKLMEDVGASNVYLNQPVIRISQEEEGPVTVTTSTQTNFVGRKVILAIPPPQIGKISFHPVLPVASREILKRMPSCNYTKVIVTFSESFWRAAGQSGEAVTNGGPSTCATCDKGPLSVVYDATSCNGNPALVSFMGGMQAVQWQAQSDEERKDAVLKSLAEIFGKKVYTYLDYVEKNWDIEPFQDGAPICCVSPGAMRYLVKGLRQPFKNIHFAGTETATVWCGYMNGAVQSGRRSAIEVLYDIRPQLVTKDDLQELRSTQAKGSSTAIKFNKGSSFSILKMCISLFAVALLAVAASRMYSSD